MLRGWWDRLSGGRDRRSPTEAAAPPAGAAGAAPSAAPAGSPEPPPVAAAAVDWIARGNAALAAQQLEEAGRCYEQGIVALPQDAAPRLNLGFVLLQQGRFEAACERLQQAIALHRPGQGLAQDAWYLLGCAQDGLGRSDDALASFAAAVRLKPDFAEPMAAAVQAATRLGRAEDALQWAQRLVDLSPEPEHRLQLAGALLQAGRAAQALPLLDALCAEAPQQARVQFLRYEALRTLGDWEAALPQAERVRALVPSDAAAVANVGFVLEKLDRLDEALARADEALRLDARNRGALANRVAVLMQLGRTAEARDAAREALRHHPDDPNLHWNLGLCHLLLGELEPGWPEHEWRFRSDAVSDGRPRLAEPAWQGEDLSGRTLFVYGEQGFGDTVQFVRYVGQVARRARQVLLQVQPALEPLMKGLPANCRLLRAGEAMPPFDVHCALMSLPALLGTTLQTIPADVPYLHADPQAVQAWRERLGNGALNVGIAWSGNASQANDRRRSTTLANFRGLATEGCRFVIVQPDLRPGDRAVLAGWPEALDAGRELRDFADTAALLTALDLVISVDTSVAHLAGALGRPVWVLLSWVPDWRWLLQRDDSPWYPTARLFRQQARGEWAPLVQRVRAELQVLAGSR